MKNRVLLVLLIILLVFFNINSLTAHAEESNIYSKIDEILDKINLDDFNDYMSGLQDLLNNNSKASVKSYIKEFLNGNLNLSYDSILKYVLSLILSNFSNVLPDFISLLALIILYSIINSIKADYGSSQINDIVHFICLTLIASTIGVIIYKQIDSTNTNIQRISKLLEFVTPILITLMTALGITSSVAIYNPSMIFVVNTVTVTVVNLFIPIISLMFVLNVVSSIGNNLRLKKFQSFLASTLKWIIGLILIIFSLFFTLQGLASGIYDGISVRALKYAINSSVPLVGGLVKDGIDLILASTVLVKNSIGILSLVVIFLIIISPVINLIVISLMIKLLSAISSFLCNDKISSFFDGSSQVINFLLASTLMIVFIFFIILILMICSVGAIY